MRPILRHLAAALYVLAVASSARAATPLTFEQQTFTAPVRATIAINTACDANIHNVLAPACASFSLPMRGWTEATLLVLYTKGTATAVQVQLDGAIDQDNGGTLGPEDLPFGILQTGSVDATQITMSTKPAAWDVSAQTGATSTAWLVTFKGLNADWVRWRFTATGANASDTVKVWLVRVGK